MVCLCGAVIGPAGSGGEGVYKCVCRWELLLCVGVYEAVASMIC